MDDTAARDNHHKIVILNPKGGSGKTTLATNLASYFAMRGPPPTLVDCDPGGYSMRWIDKRPAVRPQIYGIEAYHRGDNSDRPLRPWFDSTEMIVDLPAAIDSNSLIYETYDAHSILVPIVPSEIDIHSATKFIADLLLATQLDRHTRSLGIVANRTRHYTRSYRRLMRFLRSLDIPIVAEFRDSQNFVHAATFGLGICELPQHKVRQDLEQLRMLAGWLDRGHSRRLDRMIAEEIRRVPDKNVEVHAEAIVH